MHEKPLENLAYKCSLPDNLYFPLIDCIQIKDPHFAWVAHHEMVHRSSMGIGGLRTQLRSMISVLFELLLDIENRVKSKKAYKLQVQKFVELLNNLKVLFSSTFFLSELLPALSLSLPIVRTLGYDEEYVLEREMEEVNAGKKEFGDKFIILYDRIKEIFTGKLFKNLKYLGTAVDPAFFILGAAFSYSEDFVVAFEDLNQDELNLITNKGVCDCVDIRNTDLESEIIRRFENMLLEFVDLLSKGIDIFEWGVGLKFNSPILSPYLLRFHNKNSLIEFENHVLYLANKYMAIQLDPTTLKSRLGFWLQRNVILDSSSICEDPIYQQIMLNPGLPFTPSETNKINWFNSPVFSFIEDILTIKCSVWAEKKELLHLLPFEMSFLLHHIIQASVTGKPFEYPLTNLKYVNVLEGPHQNFDGRLIPIGFKYLDSDRMYIEDLVETFTKVGILKS